MSNDDVFSTAVSTGDDAMDSLFDRLADAQTMAALNSLLDNIGLAAELVEAVGGALPAGRPLLEKTVDQGILESLTSSSMFNPEVVEVMNIVTKAMSSAAIKVQRSDELLSPQRLLWKLRDPDINRALRFFTTILQEIGKELDPVRGNFSPRN